MPPGVAGMEENRREPFLPAPGNDGFNNGFGVSTATTSRFGVHIEDERFSVG
jgi:hypothetical protein